MLARANTLIKCSFSAMRCAAGLQSPGLRRNLRGLSLTSEGPRASAPRTVDVPLCDGVEVLDFAGRFEVSRTRLDETAQYLEDRLKDRRAI